MAEQNDHEQAVFSRDPGEPLFLERDMKGMKWREGRGRRLPVLSDHKLGKASGYLVGHPSPAAGVKDLCRGFLGSELGCEPHSLGQRGGRCWALPPGLGRVGHRQYPMEAHYVYYGCGDILPGIDRGI